MDSADDNLRTWVKLQEAGYFHTHPFYDGGHRWDTDEPFFVDQRLIEFRGRPLGDTDVVAVIGCGYGRESMAFCRKAALVYGVDVHKCILSNAVANVLNQHTCNFVPVLYEDFLDSIRLSLNLVFSVTVLQHVPDKIVERYLAGMGAKLAPSGLIIVQFAECETMPGIQEPHFSRTMQQSVDLHTANGLKVVSTKSVKVAEYATWHWVVSTRQ